MINDILLLRLFLYIFFNIFISFFDTISGIGRYINVVHLLIVFMIRKKNKYNFCLSFKYIRKKRRMQQQRIQINVNKFKN